MRICRLQIKNFRNFACLDVALGEHAVIVGENKIGKSNLLYALRLILDPSLPDSARKLREEDFWDGLRRPLTTEDRIIISVDIADFESDENQLAILAGHLVEPDPMVARITYVWQPIAGLTGGPTKEADYEFSVYGGDRLENRVSYEVRRRLPLELLPALRDCEADMARWTRSPLRPILEKVAGAIDRDTLETLAQEVDKATAGLAGLEQVRAVAVSIRSKLAEMVGASQALETALRFSPNDPDKLIRELRIFIDGGRRGLSEASLGSANLLYFALKALEYDQLVADGDRDHTFLAVEEPEAHLHPNLQRLIFRSYLQPRQPTAGGAPAKPSTILMTTHSPHIASVAPLDQIVVLRADPDSNATEAVSTARLVLDDDEKDDLERYIDVYRGELFFARGVILVEGDAEKYLLPVLAKGQGFDLDELGIAVCSVSGTNFTPYLKLIGPTGLNIPFIALTDNDPRQVDGDQGQREPLSLNRLRRILRIVLPDIPNKDLRGPIDELLNIGMKNGIFINANTLEVDLFRCGLKDQFAGTMASLTRNKEMAARMTRWKDDPNSLNVEEFLSDVEAVGKGRFAQRLSTIIAKGNLTKCPEYIKKGVAHVVDKCRRN